MSSRRASRQQARRQLEAAERDGDIFGFEAIDGGRWLLYVQPTRLAHHRDPDARGELVLTTREVFAFAEGRLAARRVVPVHRAGDA